MKVDRAVVARAAQKRDQALTFAEPIDADDMGAVGKLVAGLEQLRRFLAGIAVLEHGQRERRLCNEKVAGGKLEARAGRVRAPLVVAGDDRPRTLPFDQNLRAAKHMTGREERDRDVADRHALAVGDGLASLLRRSAEPHLHHTERLARGEHMVVPRPRMVGMAVGHDRALGAAIRVDMEAAGAAIEALAVDREPGFETFGGHLLSGAIAAAAEPRRQAKSASESGGSGL